MIVSTWDVEGNKHSVIDYEAKKVCGGIFDKYLQKLPNSFFAIYETQGLFHIIESTSGCSVGKGKSKQEALESARKCLAAESVDTFTEIALECGHAFEKLKNKKLKLKLIQPMPKRAIVFKKNDGKCFYCDDQLEIDAEWHIEHKHPKSKGGTNDLENLVPSCRPCNLKKHNKTAKEFLEASI
jgi:hypothetical protein